MQIALITIVDEYYVRVGNALPVAPFLDSDNEAIEASDVNLYTCCDAEDLLTDPAYNLRDINNYLYALICDELPTELMKSPFSN